MPTRHIAIVPEFGLNPSELARVSAALQKQVTRDLGPVWDVDATVDPFPSLEDIPAGYWPIVVTFRSLATEAGVHVDRNGHPYALVEMCPSWSVTASHVCLEMVTDPFGSRTFPGASPRHDQGEVEFSGGICDPCEHPDHAYLVNDVLVSDFCTPAYFDPASKDRRSFTSAIKDAFEVLPGGHLCWYDPATNGWWIRRHDGTQLVDDELGVAEPERGTVREFVDRRALHLLSTKMTLEQFEARVGSRRQNSLRASQSRAYWLRASLGHTADGVSLEFDDEVHQALHAARSSRAHPMVGQLFSASRSQVDPVREVAHDAEPNDTTELDIPSDDSSVLVDGHSHDVELEKEAHRSLDRAQSELRDLPDSDRPRHSDSHSAPTSTHRRAGRTTPPPIPVFLSPSDDRPATSIPPSTFSIPSPATAPAPVSVSPATASIAPPRSSAGPTPQSQNIRTLLVSSLAVAACLAGVGFANLRNAWPLRTSEGTVPVAAGAPNSMPAAGPAPAVSMVPYVSPSAPVAAAEPQPTTQFVGERLARPAPLVAPAATRPDPEPEAPAAVATVKHVPPRIRPSAATAPAASAPTAHDVTPTAAAFASAEAAEGLASPFLAPPRQNPVRSTRSSASIEGLIDNRR